MATDNSNALIDVTGSFINKKFKEQSWFKENSNTITTLGGLIATVVAWAATQPFALNPSVQIALILVGFLLTVFGVKATPNGISKSQLKQFANAEAKYIDSTPLVTQDSADLDSMVAEYAKER